MRPGIEPPKRWEGITLGRHYGTRQAAVRDLPPSQSSERLISFGPCSEIFAKEGSSPSQPHEATYNPAQNQS
ncbi:MAG: hypothetical protein KJ718_05575 [Nanoarchaeota archaeon]|nr:hypothetical protein [Nanoarchaeota archaeon]MBU1051993.1 hypothetical protein [Nanoarchaeota archaeon]MBU1988249.1 hypothetical protein [Nanoarchaeota archaeon]